MGHRSELFSRFVALILRESDVQDLIEMDEVIAAVEDAMRELGEGDAHNEPRRRAFAPGGILNVMFAAYPGGKCTGLKGYTVSNGHVRFMRAMFAEEQSEQLGVQIVAADTAETAVRGADIVVTVTTSPAPVLEAEWVEPHAFVAAVGSNFRNRTEVPPELVERAHTVVVDQLAAAQLESGDLIQAAEAGKFDWRQAVELGAVVAGRWERPERAGIMLFESHGLALWDLAAASVV